jgi:hypothetical protein
MQDNDARFDCLFPPYEAHGGEVGTTFRVTRGSCIEGGLNPFVGVLGLAVVVQSVGRVGMQLKIRREIAPVCS